MMLLPRIKPNPAIHRLSRKRNFSTKTFHGRMYRMMNGFCHRHFPGGQFLLQRPINSLRTGYWRVILNHGYCYAETETHCQDKIVKRVDSEYLDEKAALLLFCDWIMQDNSSTIMDEPDWSGRNHLIAEEETTHGALIDWTKRAVQDITSEMDTNDRPDTLWTTKECLSRTMRRAFATQSRDVVASKTWAIKAFQFLQAQHQLQQATSVNTENGICVVSTSNYAGKALPSPTRHKKARFTYRIRIENNSSNAVQLLGRTWIIHESNASSKTPIEVHAPQTGAVGQLPVIPPGFAFEYQSGVEISLDIDALDGGKMEGCLHLCWVEPNTPSAVVGEHVTAFESDERFQVTVAPFPLDPTL